MKDRTKIAYSISLLTYKKLTRFLESNQGSKKQIDLFKAAVDALKVDPSPLKEISAQIRGENDHPPVQNIVNHFDKKSVRIVEQLAKDHDLFKCQVVDAAFQNFIGSQVLCGAELNFPSDLIAIKGGRWLSNTQRPLSYIPLPVITQRDKSVFVDATILFAGITSVDEGKSVQSHQCAKFIRCCLAREIKAFTTAFEIGRLEQLLRCFTEGNTDFSNWLTPLVLGISIVEVTHSELAVEEPLAQTVSARAALAAFVKQGSAYSIATLSCDFEKYRDGVKTWSRLRKNGKSVCFYMPTDLPK